jgi:hypothetical protein
MPKMERPAPMVVGNGAAISASDEQLQNIATGAEAQATAKPDTWRNHLRVHPAADLLPRMSAVELQELADDIEKNGLRVRVVTFSDDDGIQYLLDGRNRLDALELLGRPIFDALGHRNYSFFGDRQYDLDPYDYVISTNVKRRHLTAEQKRELIAKLLKARPEQSNRQTAKLVGVDDKTVGKVRTEMEATAEIPQLDKTTGADGKARPARKMPAAKDAPIEIPSMSIAEAATLLEVSEGDVRKAIEINRLRPDLGDEVLAGEVDLEEAYFQATKRISPAVQPSRCKTPEKRREQFYQRLNVITSACSTALSMSVPTDDLTDAQVASAITRLDDTFRILGELRQRLVQARNAKTRDGGA